MEIHGFNKTTLLDFPEHVACTVFTGHCNMRCPFCHNGDLVLMPSSQPTVPEEEFFAFLNKRKNILEGVAITGGEPTLRKDIDRIFEILYPKSRLLELSTNGYNTEKIVELAHVPAQATAGYIVKYSNGPHQNPSGLMSPGTEVYVCNKMDFNVRSTHQS